MIKDFVRDEKNGEVKWVSDGVLISKKYNNKIQAELIVDQNRVLVVSDHKESGPQNLCIYDEKGEVVLKPMMPKLNNSVDGVYSVWFIPGSKIQKVVLLTDEYSPFDTVCNLNINTGEFSDFHRTK
ncbi:hypothetical protein ACJJID_12785 [Microbulbifer sp. CnH-101-G]|uniref:hypothetical protein n=1 Tax=Microbulbifer sp. CnH-101-G TaxID=3243393 RepID=UPI00403A045F